MPETTTQSPLDEERVNRFASRVFDDFGATLSGALLHLGDRLGLYRALAESGPLGSAELAERTGTAERYVREWLANQCASGYLDFEPGAGTYRLPPEHAAVLADENSPTFLAGGYEAVVGLFQTLDRVESAFRSGEGIGWGEHHSRLFCGTERFFGPTYRSSLVQQWIPALDGVRDKLLAGGRVADVGCGHGASSIILARAFPAAEVVGIEPHAESVRTAQRRATAAGVDERVRFEVGSAQDFAAGSFDLIAFFDCLHDMGDPLGAARHARAALRDGGTVMIVEPMAGDRLEENLNPVGRAYYGFSTLVCTPASLAQPGRCGLGAQAGEARLRELLTRAGFGHIRRAAETAFNLVLEVRA